MVVLLRKKIHFDSINEHRFAKEHSVNNRLGIKEIVHEQITCNFWFWIIYRTYFGLLNHH